jgi:hypothetical protein
LFFGVYSDALATLVEKLDTVQSDVVIVAMSRKKINSERESDWDANWFVFLLKSGVLHKSSLLLLQRRNHARFPATRERNCDELANVV